MMQASELLQLAKRLDETTLNSEEIKPVALAIIELRLSKGISLLVSQSVSQSVKFKKIHISLVVGFMVDMKTFSGLAIPA